MTDDGIGPPLVDPALRPRRSGRRRGRRRARWPLMTLGAVSRSGRLRGRGRRAAAAPDAQRPGVVAPTGAARCRRSSRSAARAARSRRSCSRRRTRASGRCPRSSRSTAARPGHGTARPIRTPCCGRPPATASSGRTSAARTTAAATGSRRCSVDWGGVDAADCHAVLDHLVRAGLADPERLGCYGNSYGGFMVNWLVGTSDRFAAAVSVERRRQPGLGLRELRLRRDVQRVRGPRHAADAGGRRRACGASRRCATSRTSRRRC